MQGRLKFHSYKTDEKSAHTWAEMSLEKLTIQVRQSLPGCAWTCAPCRPPESRHKSWQPDPEDKHFGRPSALPSRFPARATFDRFLTMGKPGRPFEAGLVVDLGDCPGPRQPVVPVLVRWGDQEALQEEVACLRYDGCPIS